MEQWYTLYTNPNAEYQVTAALQQRQIETYLPELLTPKVAKGSRTQPFFPCYLFARIDFEQGGFATVRWTPGLRRILSFDDQPAAVPPELIELIQKKVEAINLDGGLPRHSFKPGDTVRIKAGPFQDMLARFDSPTSPAERVQVLLEMLGRFCRVKVAVTDLEKAEPIPAPILPKRPRRSRGRGRPISSSGQNAPSFFRV